MGRYYSDYLIHSSGPWKKHKYTSKKRGKKGWIYYYESEKDARDAGDYNEDGGSDWKDKAMTLNPFDRRANPNNSEFSRFEDWLGMDEKKAADIDKKDVDYGKSRLDTWQLKYMYSKRKFNDSKQRFDAHKNRENRYEVSNNKRSLDFYKVQRDYYKKRLSEKEAKYEKSKKAYRRTPIGLLDFRYGKDD